MSTLSAYDPFSSVGTNDIFSGYNAPSMYGRRRTRDPLPVPWSMDVDALDGESEYIVLCELPGISKEDVQVNIENNFLNIRAVKDRPKELPQENARWRLSEICVGQDVRSIQLPLNLDQEKVNCCFKDGVLCVKFPKIVGHSTNKQLEITA